MKHDKLKGLTAAAFTPMDEEGKVKLPVIEPYAKGLIDAGISGIFVCGTTGESASLTLQERKEIATEWVRVAKGKIKVIIHVGCNAQPDAIELARHAREIGADAVAAIAPNFFKPASIGDLIDFFVPIAAGAQELPFYYYHMPSMTGVDLSVAQFLQEGKSRIPTLAGVKFTHNNLMEMGQCIHLDNGAFDVLHGFDETLITGLALGAVAGVGSTYNYLPDVYLGIMDAMRKKELERARELQMQSIAIVEIIIKYGGGVRGGKAIMNLLSGMNFGSCRSPIAPFSNQEYEMLNKDLNKVRFFEMEKGRRTLTGTSTL